jgi:nitrogen fixation/metabolism regulation signal transduction histidine kinase
MSDLDSLGESTVPATPDRTGYEPAVVVKHITHEIREHLDAIESIAFYLEMILPRTDAKARRQLGKLQYQVHQVNWILADAIHFLQAAPLKTQFSDLGELVTECLGEWNALGGPEVLVDFQADLPVISVDPEQFQHLLRNLVTFFRGISCPNRAIRLRTFLQNGEVCLGIECAEPQVALEDLERLFEPFGADLPVGTGLALASVRRIADAHAARLEVRSDRNSASIVLAFPGRAAHAAGAA